MIKGTCDLISGTPQFRHPYAKLDAYRSCGSEYIFSIFPISDMWLDKWEPLNLGTPVPSLMLIGLVEVNIHFQFAP